MALSHRPSMFTLGRGFRAWGRARSKTVCADGWPCRLVSQRDLGREGVFVSGGSMANLTGLMLAPDQKLKFEERARGVAYVSDQTHPSVAKGLRIWGFRN